MPNEATDPELLKFLNSPTEATDPGLLSRLDGNEPHPSQANDGSFTATFAPYSFSQPDDAGHDVALKTALPFGPTPAGLVSYLRARGISAAVPKFVMDVLDANNRGVSGDYENTEEGQRQRTQDALTVATSMLGIAPGAAPAAKVIPAAAAGRAGTPAVAPAAAAGVGTRDAALQAAQRVGVEVPEAVAGGPITRALGAAVRDAPVVGQPIADATDKALSQIEGAVNRTADSLGGSSALGAGYAMKDNLVDWVKNVSRTEAEEIYKPARDLIGDTKAALTHTQDAIQRLTQEAAEIGQKPPSVVNYLNASVARGDLTFEQMQRLRTEIGDRISGNIVPEPGSNKTALKVAYKALTDDIDALAASAGDKAQAAWKLSNDQFRTRIAAKRDALTKIVGLEGEASAEDVARHLTTMAGAKRGADIERLRLAKETASPGAWNELASSVVGNLGRTPDGFSTARFRADYAKLSDEGKTILFSPENKAALDDIATLSRRFVQFDKLSNHSRTAVTGGTMLAGYGLVTRPLELLASMIGGRAMAMALARPATAKATANWLKAHEAVVRPALGASSEKVTEETIRTRQDAWFRLQDALDREGIPLYPAFSDIAGDQPINDEVEDD